MDLFVTFIGSLGSFLRIPFVSFVVVFLLSISTFGIVVKTIKDGIR